MVGNNISNNNSTLHMPSTNLHVPLFQIALAKRADKVYPVPGPWINGGVIKSLSNIEAGTKPPGSADCEDNDGLAISLPCALSANSQEGLPLQVGIEAMLTCSTLSEGLSFILPNCLSQ